MRFAIICVYYNLTIEESMTGKTLFSAAEGREQVRLFAVDNSTDEAIRKTNRAYAGQHGIAHIDMQGNQGLSHAYNAAIDRIVGENDAEAEDLWIITADQDTTFPDNYLKAIASAAEGTEALLLAPVVRSGELILSPCRKKGARFCVCTGDWQEGDSKELYYVNTGLCLRGSLFTEQGLRYNKDLFLDFTDFDLEMRIRAYRPDSATVLPDLVLEQAFSGIEETRTAEQDLERCRIYAHDGEVFYQTWYPNDSSYKAFLLGRKLKLALRHRDGRFLKKH